MKPPDLPYLRDVWFQGVNIDWPSATAAMQFEPEGDLDDPYVRVVVRDLKEIRIPRAEPWGPSEYVYEARFVSRSPTLGEIQVEMQSGDVLTFVGGSFDVDFVKTPIGTSIKEAFA